MKRFQATKTRRGFTLIELLLAIGLCGLLMSATMSAVHLSWKYRVDGDRSVEQTERIRGVYDDIAADLRNGVSPDFRAAETPSGVAPAAFEALQQLIQLEEETEIEQADFSEQFLDVSVEGRIDPVHFYGESDFFSILTDRKSHRFPDAQSGTERQHIVWTAGETALRLPFHLRDGKLIDSARAKSPFNGIVRWQRVFDARTESVEPARADTILPEAKSIAFRYFNGSRWSNSWNSHQERSLPVAVELHITTANETSHQFVVRLPQSRKVVAR